MAEILVPDTSVLIDGRISELVESDYPKARILVPLATLAELEAQANRALETGFAGLDELHKLQGMAERKECSVEFAGLRPSADDIQRADAGAIDALIRDVAVDNHALFVTSDRVQAHAASAQGVRHHYIRPIIDAERDLSQLEISSYFEDDVMSVHLKADCIPMLKRGTPGEVVYEPAGTMRLGHADIRAIARQCIEYAKRDYESFVEMERNGCTVCQIGPMRTTIAQPPFSDGLEITAVRPVFKATLSDYDLPEEIMKRIEGKARGVFVAGPPGSGKSTFAAAVAEHLHGLHRVIKTMEQPRDLQVPKEITQYGALDRDMKWTGDVILLVRPDHVIYDEVRTTGDFTTFADMRLAGIGLFGVTHANRAIDAIQRLIGRVDLGMIPQVIDTVVFIDDGAVATILELDFTVKVPDGMMSEDLARPVVVVKDVLTGAEVYELYSFGEQVVVMPLGASGSKKESTGAAAAAERELRRQLKQYVDGPMDVQVRGNKATVFVDQWAVPQLIGKGGRTVQGLEHKLGIRLDVRPRPARSHDEPVREKIDEAGGLVPKAIKQTGNNVYLILNGRAGDQWYTIEIEGSKIGECKASKQGKIRFKSTSAEGSALMAADQSGLDVRCLPMR